LVIFRERGGTDPAPVHSNAPPDDQHDDIDDDEDEGVDAEAEDEEDIDPGDEEKGPSHAEPDGEPVIADVHVLVANDHLGERNNEQKHRKYQQNANYG